MNGSTIMAGLFAAAGLSLAIYAWAPRPDPGSPEAAQFPNEKPYVYKYDDVTPELRAAAAAGDLDAQFELGALLVRDAGQQDAPAEAVEWLLAAAESGHPLAANEIGYAYKTGRLGLPRDADAAFQWFRRGAAGGDQIARYNVAVSYRDGSGAKRDDALAARHFLLSAEHGVSAAQYNLALLLREGVGVARSVETARRALAAARRQGYDEDDFYTDNLATPGGGALNTTKPSLGALAGGGPVFDEPARTARCRAAYGDVDAIAASVSGAVVTRADKQRALMRIAALLGDPYAQSALANYWKSRPQDPRAADEEYYWRMRAARNPLKLEIPADCGVRG